MSVLGSVSAEVLARAVVERVREPMLTQAGMLSTSCSVGLASGGGATEPEQLLREADTAVYAAKRAYDAGAAAVHSICPTAPSKPRYLCRLARQPR